MGKPLPPSPCSLAKEIFLFLPPRALKMQYEAASFRQISAGAIKPYCHWLESNFNLAPKPLVHTSHARLHTNTVEMAHVAHANYIFVTTIPWGGLGLASHEFSVSQSSQSHFSIEYGHNSHSSAWNQKEPDR